MMEKAVGCLNEIQLEKERLTLEISELTSQIETLESQLKAIGLDLTPDEKRDPKERQEMRALNKFKMSIDEGIRFIIQEGMSTEKPADIAQYIFNLKAVDKQVLGDYLSKKHAFNISILEEYVKLFDFRGKHFIDSLRELLHTFQMVGESQVIERTMDIFSKVFVAQNPTFQLSSDSLSVLCYACLMLQTSLHNKTAKKDKYSLKTPEEFDNMLARCEGLNNLDKNFTREIFENIKATCFVNQAGIYEESMGEIIKSGYLLKEGGNHKSWKKRFFVLNSVNMLLYYTHDKTVRIKGSIVLSNLSVKVVDDEKFCFEIYPTDYPFTINAWKVKNKQVPSKHRKFRICASSHQEMEQWMVAISKSIADADSVS